MSDKLYCTYCGALNDAESAFCGRCGHALEPLDTPAKEKVEERAASDGQEDLLAALMSEPVTKIKEEPAPERRRPNPDETILDEHGSGRAQLDSGL